MARTYLSYRYLLLTLLVTWVYAQNCENDYAGYAADFSDGSQDRWLYENIAPGAECVSISRTQTEEEICSELVSRLPDASWPTYPEHKLTDGNAVVLQKSYSDTYSTHATFTIDVCINACRIRPWCKSVVWNYGYDKCRLNYIFGTPEKVNVDYKTYIQKPACPNPPMRNTSVAYFRLGLKLFAAMEYRMAADMMKVAMESDKYKMINYWGYSIMNLLANDFSQDSIDEADITMSLTGFEGEFPDNVTGTELEMVNVLTDALKTSNVPLNMATGYKQLFEDSGKTDNLAAMLAALAYKKVEDTDMFKSLLENIIDGDSSNIGALRLYLSMVELDREELLEQDKTIILDFISKLKAADPNNPKVLTKAMAIYYLYGMPKEAMALLSQTLTALTDAADNGFISESKKITDILQAYSYAHNSALFFEDLSEAEQLETKVDAMANDVNLYIELRASIKALVYRMKAQRYFQFAFTLEIPANLPASIDDIDDIASSGVYTTPLKISQNIYRQAVVTLKIRGGKDSEYDEMIEVWKSLSAASDFDDSFSPVVNYSMILLQVEKALMDGESWETIFGESGYLNSAYKLVKDVESAYRIMGMPEVVAYAVMKVSMNTPALLSRSGSEIPDSLDDLLEDIDESFLNNSPNKVHSKAWLYLALGKPDMGMQLLEAAKDRLVQAKLQWLEDAFVAVKDYNSTVSMEDLEPIPYQVSTSLEFNDEEVVWIKKPKQSIMSTKSKSYKSTNVFSCKQRCIFEDSFKCNSFSFGYNRCLLHNEKMGDDGVVAYDDADDEVYYGVPDIPDDEDDTNAYSQLRLGAKALSNSLFTYSYDKFTTAAKLDPVMAMPKLMQAFILGLVAYRGEDAAYILSTVTVMTPYEKTVHSAIGYVLSGEDIDAKDELNDFLKTASDPFIQNFVNELDDKVSTSPVIAADYIYRLSRNMSRYNDDISELRRISPVSPVPRVLKVYDFYRQGSWTELVAEAKSVENDADTFLAFESSVAKILLLQLKHYALVQLGRLSEAAALYQDNIDGDIGAFLYATQLYSGLVISMNDMPSIADPSAINDQDDDDDSSEWGRVIAWVMDAVKVYVQENADTSVKAVKKNALEKNLLELKNPIIGPYRSAWTAISNIFYSLNQPEAKEKAKALLGDREQLSPAVLIGFGVELIAPEELIVLASLNQTEETLGTKVFEEMETYLNQVQPPSRSVTLWLKYLLYRRWRDYDDSHRQESIDAAADLENQWTDGNQGTAFEQVSEYRSYPDPPGDVNIQFKTPEEGNAIPEWAVYLIIGMAALVMVAIIISCVVCLAMKKKGNEKNVYNGSIYSASSAGRGDNVLPEHGDLVYGGQRNDGFSLM